MAKAKKEPAAAKRKQAAAEQQKKAGKLPTTADDLFAAGKRLRDAAEALEAQAETMKERNMEPIEVLGHDGLNRAYEQINSFLGNCINKIPQF